MLQYLLKIMFYFSVKIQKAKVKKREEGMLYLSKT